MNIFSPNMIKTYQTCPHKYFFRYVENINIPQSSLPFEKGKKIHALANYKLQGIKIDKLEKALNEKESAIWNLLQQNPYYNKDSYKSEFALSVKLDNYWIGGRLDAVVKDENNFFILDYKTGSAPDNAKYDYQTMIYLLAMDKYLKEYSQLSFVYIDLKNNTNNIINFDKELGKEYKNLIINACNTIVNDNLFDFNPSKCKFCEYNKICSQ